MRQKKRLAEFHARRTFLVNGDTAGFTNAPFPSDDGDQLLAVETRHGFHQTRFGELVWSGGFVEQGAGRPVVPGTFNSSGF